MEQYFYLEDSSIYQDKCVLRFKGDESFCPNTAHGSYSVLPARILNLDYVDYLRYVRDRLGAELIGKNMKYITPYFSRTTETKLFVEILNKQIKLIKLEHEHPDVLQEDGSEKIEKIPLDKNEDNT